MKLNNKGFTLIEILMTVVILGIIMAIAIPFGISYFSAAKIKTETIFVNKLNKLIDDYITLENNNFEVSSTSLATFKKCKLDVKAAKKEKNEVNCEENHNIYKVTVDGNDKIPFEVLINSNLITEGDFINPYESKRCSMNKDEHNYLEIFKDDDSVFYFRYKLDCISHNNNKAKNEDETYIENCNTDKCFVYNNVPTTE